MKKFLLIIFLSLLFSGCTSPKNFERTEILMGTVVTLKVEGKNSRAAVDESFRALFELEKKISADVKKIEDAAGNGAFVKISPDVYEILTAAQKFSALTDGAFDVTIGAAVELWGIGTENPRVPPADELAAVKNFVGHEHLHLRGGEAYLDRRGVKINLGGVGKGYGVDVARKIFIAHGVTSGLIDFGTSTIFAVGKKKIGIKNPRAEEISAVVELENCALSTSGDYEKFFIADGRRCHHIIDPKTCAPAASENFSVSVLVGGGEKNCATLADILSTTAFILGEERTEKILTENKIAAKIFSAP
ncbi:MAG: FAD:protein FMN transferase [Selenomonadaceae bacterium]|nr:FAD:protein FMN transferase [Selenomonadaceae bacterium]